MKQVFILVEGQTEQTFVKELLAKYMYQQGVTCEVNAVLIRTSKTGKGGFTNYEYVKNDVNRLLKTPHAIVTTMMDFFRHPVLPNEDKMSKDLSHIQQVEWLEEQIDKDIDNPRFFSYIQMHEFEALLFASDRGFNEYLSDKNREISKIMNEYPNPEDINTSPQGAPSKRLIAIDSTYDKVIQGNLIALEVGIEDMLQKCPRFKQWVERLIVRVKEEY